jgi:carboxylesterase
MFHSRERAIAEQKMLGHGDMEMFAEGRAPAVVAFHGFGGTVAELRPVLDAIAGTGYAVDAALLPGHGTRVEELQDQTFDTWVDASRRRMNAERQKHGRFVLFGFSLGSLIALQLAAEHPEGLAGLVVLGNALTLAPLMNVPFTLWQRLGRELPDAYLGKPRAGDLVDESAMGSLVTYDRHPIRSAFEVYRAGPRVRRVVGQVRCPTLVMHGRRDIVCSWKNAKWLTEHVGTRDVSVRIFERSAHVLCCDGERDEVSRETLAFLGRLG